MVLELVALSRILWTVPPNSSSWAVVMGTTARSSWLPNPWLPAGASTPITWNGICLTSTMSPTPAPRFAAVVEPSTITCVRVATSCALRNVPLLMVRVLVTSHPSVLPKTVELQFADPITSDARPCETGATASMSGALCRSCSPWTSAMVSVLALPAPPNTPAETVLPAEIVRRFVPSDVIRAVTLSDEAWPMPTVAITAATPNKMPSVVSTDRRRCPSRLRSPVSMVLSRLTRRPVRRAGRLACAPCASRRARPQDRA